MPRPLALPFPCVCAGVFGGCISSAVLLKIRLKIGLLEKLRSDLPSDLVENVALEPVELEELLWG